MIWKETVTKFSNFIWIAFFENIPLPLKAMPCELSPIFKALTLNKQWGPFVRRNGIYEKSLGENQGKFS